MKNSPLIKIFCPLRIGEIAGGGGVGERAGGIRGGFYAG